MGASQFKKGMERPTKLQLVMTPYSRVACIPLTRFTFVDNRFFKSKYSVRVTLLTNDNNLAVKAQSNGIATLSRTTPNNEPLSSDLLIRQALHGPLPLESMFIRPKEGNDIQMFDLSGTM